MTSSPSSLLPYGRQSIDADDIAAVVAALRSDWLTQGPRVAEFEQAFAQPAGVEHAVDVEVVGAAPLAADRLVEQPLSAA